ncbi:small ribosomal subunit protein uS9m isoform X2 [Phascolarctos cinereus]
MAAPWAPFAATVTSFLFIRGRSGLARSRVAWKAAATEYRKVAGPQLLRLVHTTSTTQKKNVATSRREEYTVAFIKKQIEEFNIGKRHLANMMGEDPETFTQEDIDRAIAYLFPSGLFEKRARPIMKHPDDIFPRRRVIQWGEDGRPFHFLFYTGKPAYYSLMHEVYGMMLDLDKRSDDLRAKGLLPQKNKQDLIGSRWLIKEELEEMLVEKLSAQDHMRFIQQLERLLTLPCGSTEEEYIHKFRRTIPVQSKKKLIQPLQYDEQGMGYSSGEGKRKTAKAKVIVYEHGSGRIKVNGIDYLLYFPVTQDRSKMEIIIPVAPTSQENN